MNNDGIEVRTNGTTNAAYSSNQEGEQPSLLALICGNLCKDTPLAELFANEQPQNQNNAQNLPLQTVSNGEKFQIGTKIFLLLFEFERNKDTRIIFFNFFILSTNF